MNTVKSMKKQMYKGLVVLDVDGVLFKDIFLKRIVRSRGLKNYMKILWLGIMYYINKITINKLLEEGYKLARDFNAKKAQVTANKIRRVTNIKATIEILHQEEFYVSLISAGIPNFVLKDLAEEIEADHYAGLDIEINEGIIDVDKIKLISKIETVEKILQRLELKWKDVVSVGDDPNNVELLKKSRIGIGFNPCKIVRKYSDTIIEGNNFFEILPYVIPPERLPRKLTIQRFSWKRELFRKGIHLLGCVCPFLAQSNKLLTIYILLGIITVYFLSEFLRYMGVSFLLFSHITRRAQRHIETRSIIIGPILLGLGIMFTILFFHYHTYLPAILIVSISDSFSALIGIRFGKTRIFGLKNRTVIGSLTFFLSSFIILFLTVPARLVLPATMIATLLELIPVYNLDNLLIPTGTALFLHLRGIYSHGL